MKSVTLRIRITVWSALIVGSALLLMSCSAALFVYFRAIRELDERLNSVTEKFLFELERHGGESAKGWERHSEIKEWLPIANPPFFIEIARANGRLVYRSKNLEHNALPVLAPGFGYARVGHKRIRLGTFKQQGVIVRVGADLDRITEMARDLTGLFVTILPLLLGFVVLCGRWIAD